MAMETTTEETLMIFRLIRQERVDSYQAVRTGLSSWYILQYRYQASDPTWKTIPVVMLDDLPIEEQKQIYKELQNHAPPSF